MDEENEKRLRMAMATLFGLSPIQLLLVQHLMRGGRLAKFGDTIRVTHEQIRRYRGSERAQAGMMRDAILSRASMLAPVLAPCYAGATYHDGHDTGGNAPACDTGDVNGGTATDDKATEQEQDNNALEASLHELPAGDLFELAGLDVPFDKLERKTRR